MSRKPSSKLMPRRTAGSRALAKEALGQSAISQAMIGLARKYAPKTLRLCIKIAKKNPVESKIAAYAGIATGTLRYWLKLSEHGRPGDPFDLEIDGRVERFHIMFRDAVEQGVGEVEHKVFLAATGQEKEILTHQGRVSYKYDRDLLALGMTGEEAYLLDENGDPVPETIPLLDLESSRWFLARRRPDLYGNRQTVQVDHKHSGVLVVGIPKTSQELEETYGSMRHDTIEEVEFTEIDHEMPPVKLETENEKDAS